MAFKVWRINNQIKKVKRLCNICMNLGCGSDVKTGYINGDRYNHDADVIMNAHEIPSQTNRVELIEMHHVLEHLSQNDVILTLNECKRVLKPNGFLILSVPDLEACLKLFLKSPYDVQFGSIIKMIYGSQEHDGMFHKSGYTSRRLKYLIENVGFKILSMEKNIRTRPTPTLISIAAKGNG